VQSEHRGSVPQAGLAPWPLETARSENVTWPYRCVYAEVVLAPSDSVQATFWGGAMGSGMEDAPLDGSNGRELVEPFSCAIGLATSLLLGWCRAARCGTTYGVEQA